MTRQHVRNAAIAGLKNPETNKRLTDLGYITIGDQPEKFAVHIKHEIERLGKVVRKFNLTAD